MKISGFKATDKQVNTGLRTNDAKADLGAEAAQEQMAPNEADAASGTVDPPGVDANGSAGGSHDSDFTLEGGFLEPFIEGSIIQLVPEKYQSMTAAVCNIFISVANAYLIQSLGVLLGVAINPIGGVNTTAITLAMIKKNIKKVQQSIQKLMHKEFNTAYKRYQFALRFSDVSASQKSGSGRVWVLIFFWVQVRY